MSNPTYHTWTDEQKAYLRKVYPHYAGIDVLDKFNSEFVLSLSLVTLKSKAKVLGLRQTAECKRRRNLNNRMLTPEQHDFLRETFSTHTIRECVDMLKDRFGVNTTPSRLMNYCHRYGIKFPDKPNAGRFKAGECRYHTPKGVRRSPATEFKPGNVPPNRVPLYTTRLNSQGIMEIKVPERNPYTGAPTRFVSLARWVWEQTHGPIPAGYKVVHLGGDKNNNNADNLNNPNAVPPYSGADANPSRIALARLVAAAAAKKKAQSKHRRRT